jgi:hypothetical protein
MELVGIADIAPTLSIRALKEKGMPYALYLVDGADKSQFDALGIPVSGSFEDLIGKVDIMLDSSPGGIGAKNKGALSEKGRQGHFPGRGVKLGRRRVLPRLRKLREGARPGLFKAHKLQYHRPYPQRRLP